MTKTHMRASLAALLACVGCQPDLGDCNVEAATETLYYDEAGLPAYAGQALVDGSCGSQYFCHAQGIDPAERFGAPAGVHLDIGAASASDDPEAPDDFERLRVARRATYNLRHDILGQVQAGLMPPGPPAGALDFAPTYRTAAGDELPSIRSDEGVAILQNWLACGAPVIERTEGEAHGIGDLALRGVDAVDASCPEGQAPCDAVCVDVLADPLNCGGCGVTCGGGQSCVRGGCTCLNGLEACGTACVDVRSDVEHCGMCDESCGAQFCSESMCVASCPSGRTDCGGSCVDLNTSLANCGRCLNPCQAGQVCAGGSCSCAAGFTDCGGACVDLTSDGANCGACGTACAGGAACTASACACPGGTTPCGEACVDTQTDMANCGGCGAGFQCAMDERCSAGACVGCGPAVSFAAQIQPIFTNGNRCTASGCHVGNRPAANLNLTVGRAYDELVGPLASCGGNPLVTPGDVSRSYLWNKLNDIAICSGTPMPKRGDSLTSSQLELIESWICRGAAND